MDQKTYLNLKKKLLLALRDGMLTPEQVANAVLCIKTKKQLTNLMDTINRMYSNNELIPVVVNEEKHLMLVRR